MRSHAEESERAMHPEDAACIVFAAYQYDGSAFSRAAEFSEKGRLGRGHLRSGKAFPPKLKRDSRFLSYFKREGFELDEHLLGHMGGKPLPVGRWRTGLQVPAERYVQTPRILDISEGLCERGKELDETAGRLYSLVPLRHAGR